MRRIVHVTKVGVAGLDCTVENKVKAMEEVDNIIIETLKDIGW